MPVPNSTRKGQYIKWAVRVLGSSVAILIQYRSISAPSTQYRATPVPYLHTFFEKCDSKCMPTELRNFHFIIFKKTFITFSEVKDLKEIRFETWIQI